MNLLQGLDAPVALLVTLNRGAPSTAQGAAPLPLPPSGLLAAGGRRAGAAARDQRRAPHLLLRRLLGLRLPRGRRGQRPVRPGAFRGGPCPCRAPLRRPRPAPALRAAAARVPLPALPAVPRPRRAPAGVRRALALVGAPPALARFRRADYLGDPDGPLDDAVRDAGRERHGPRPAGPIRLLTHRAPRLRLQPGELLLLLRRRGPGSRRSSPRSRTRRGASATLRAAGARRGRAASALRFDKPFHVSPFLAMDCTTTGASAGPASRPRSTWRTARGGAASTPRWRSSAAARPAPGRALLRHPLLPLKVAAAIYWQALRLWLKRAPFHAHPDQTGAAPRGEGRIERPAVTQHRSAVDAPARPALGAGCSASAGGCARAARGAREGEIAVIDGRAGIPSAGGPPSATCARPSTCCTRRSTPLPRSAARSAPAKPTCAACGVATTSPRWSACCWRTAT